MLISRWLNSLITLRARTMEQSDNACLKPLALLIVRFLLILSRVNNTLEASESDPYSFLNSAPGNSFSHRVVKLCSSRITASVRLKTVPQVLLKSGVYPAPYSYFIK